MDDKTLRALCITSIIYLYLNYLLHINQNIYLFQIINGTMALLGICVLIKLYINLKDYNSRWRNIQFELN